MKIEKSILVLGSSSFIGENFCKIADQHKITAIARKDIHKYRNRYIYMDIDNYMQSDLFAYKDYYDSLVVFLWNGNQRDKRNDIDINMNCANSILSCIKKICLFNEIKQTVLCGSVAEYGGVSGYITEDTVPDEETISAYGKAKLYLYKQLYNERVCSRITELRFHSVYGYSVQNTQMILRLLRIIKKGEIFEMKSDCLQTYDFIHVEDAAKAICSAIDNKLHGVYNVSSNSQNTLKDYLISAVSTLGLSERLIEFGSLSEKSTYFCSDKFRNDTGWKDECDFKSEMLKISNLIDKENI